ncbi:MAG: DUF1926 domain-containing protein [Nitrospinae bacterium]|nr:DUF1926 domain-containing protein [Nitrospinota bacterium]
MFGIHNHQPVGNFEHVFEQSYETCYGPSMALLRERPAIRMAIHHSGPLLEWIEAHRPRYIDDLAALAARGQVEILSGGFYEPILTAIPEGDAVGQIEMMNHYIRGRFGQKPNGLWLAERIWDPSLPRIIARAGLSYTLLDDTHFYYAGLTAERMFGYYMTDRAGDTVAVFPIDRRLRYTIPFKDPQETIDHLRWAKTERGAPCVTYGDDGEKFGVWPGTHQWVFGEKWLEKFYTELERHSDSVRMTLFSEFLSRAPASGRVYLPLASYEEMMEWTLDPDGIIAYETMIHDLEAAGKRDAYKPFIRGGQWSNFQVKYEESNRMSKRMIHLSRRLSAAEAAGTPAPEEARRELYRAQCNCAYWHGLFGGLYLNYLRHAVYERLIAADAILDAATRPTGRWREISQFDFDGDGAVEIIAENPALFAGFAPAGGGCLFAFDYKPARFCLTNTLTRRREAYHQKLLNLPAGGGDGAQPASIHDIVRAKEDNLAAHLVYDRHTRHCFQDHLLPSGADMERFARGEVEEIEDFLTGAYRVVSLDEKMGRITLERAGRLVIRKTYSVDDHAALVIADYEISNPGREMFEAVFGVEFNLTLLASDAADRYWTGPAIADKPRLKERGKDTGVTWVGMRDVWYGFEARVSSPAPFDVWRFPVETVSQSESGFERTYQGSCVVALFPLRLAGGETARLSLSLSAEMAR